MELTFDAQSFLLNGRRFFLYSGEVHYFRIKKQYWKNHLKRLKEANLNTVSTYIPWAWHEYREGKFDFSGKTCPERDIEGFIKLCKEYKLFLIVKPGPYIVGEYINQGIPEWLSNNYPELIARRKNGKKFPPYVLTYMHPLFLKFSLKWFDKILGVIKKYQVTSKGPVFFMQVCNEVGMNLWLSGEGDYSLTSLKYYRRFLKETYRDIAVFNKLYRTGYKDFSKIKEAPVAQGTKKEDFIKYKDWHDFHRWYYALYLDFLITEIKKRGLNVPLFHNVPGWVYSRATDFPLNITMYAEVFKKHPELIFSVDHIPENLSFRNFHDDFPCNEILYSMQGREKPVFIAELQAGSREHSVRTYPNEMELFYKACLAHDIKGMNFYMFSQGKNPENKGAFGPTFYWETVLNNKGEKEALYEPVKRMGTWLKNNHALLLSSKRKADIAVGFYRPYYQTEFIYPFPGKKPLIDFAKAGLNYDPKDMMTNVFFNGVLKVLKMLNYSHDISALETVPLSQLKKYKQLWVVSLEYMDMETQKKLAQYVSGGGTLIISPTLPLKDLNLKPCTILKDTLKITQIDTVQLTEAKFDFYNQKDIRCLGRLNIYKPGLKDKKIALVKGKMCCGIEKKIAKGKAVVIGTALGYLIEEHLQAYRKLIAQSNIKQGFEIDNQYLTVIPRYINQDSLFLFVFNYHRMPQEAKLTLDFNKQRIALPKILVAGTQGLIIPVNIKIPKTDYVINYSTSEVHSFFGNNKNISLKVFGYQYTQGRIAIKCLKKPKRVLLSAKKVAVVYKKGELIMDIRHQGKTENLKIVF